MLTPGENRPYKFITDGLHIFPSEIDFQIKAYKGSGFGVDVLPALAGVGFICGAKVAATLFAGGLLSWIVIMPIIAQFGSDLVLFPASVSIADLFAGGGVWGLWSNYIRYIGAGAVVAGGFISLIKTLPMIVKTFKQSVSGLRSNAHQADKRTEKSMPLKFVGAIIAIAVLILWLAPFIPLNLAGAVIVVAFGFFFAAVTSRIVGVVGCNNNPGSGMTIATLLITCIIFRSIGFNGAEAMASAIIVGCVICSIIAVFGDTSQDLKTGFLVGSTPIKQQIGEMIGVASAAIVMGAIMLLLGNGYGFGTAALPAPQAMLMKMVVEGVMGGNLPWNLLIIGAPIAVIMEIIGLSGLVVGIGMYLPIHLSAAIMCGGLVRSFVDHKKYESAEEKEAKIQKGILYTSGMIAGEGLVGVLLSVFAIITISGKSLAEIINISSVVNLGNLGAAIMFMALLYTILHAVNGRKNAK